MGARIQIRLDAIRLLLKRGLDSFQVVGHRIRIPPACAVGLVVLLRALQEGLLKISRVDFELWLHLQHLIHILQFLRVRAPAKAHDDEDFDAVLHLFPVDAVARPLSVDHVESPRTYSLAGITKSNLPDDPRSKP